MSRIDKIKLRKEPNKIIDFKIESLKEREIDYSIDNNKWLIKGKGKGDRDINIASIFQEKKIVKNEKFPFEVRHFLIEYNKTHSSSSVLHKYNALRHFVLKFLEKKKIKIKSFSDIDYKILLLYSEFIRRNTPSSYRAYNNLISVLKYLRNNQKIKVSKDVLNSNYPNIKFRKRELNSIDIYTEKDFLILSKIVREMIKYSFENNFINTPLFIKSAYWYIAMFTGFNKTGMDNLKESSFYIEENKFIYISAEKNRSISGEQNIVVPINKDNQLFFKTIKKLIENRSKISNENLNVFSYKSKNKIYEYLGVPSDFHNFLKVREYIKENNIKDVKVLSTLKIRQFFSYQMFDNTKSEKLVSEMMGHKNVNVTKRHYLRSNINKEMQLKFNIVQNLMNKFSLNKEFDDWVLFQKQFDIKNLSVEDVYNKLNEGYFDHAIGKCIKENPSELESKCHNYINCFKCKNYSVVGENDLWKIISFKENIIKNKDYKENLSWLCEIIDETIKEFSNDMLEKVKIKISKNGLYPFWRNEIMAITIIEEYLENE